MFKRFTVAVAALFVLASSSYAAGTIPGISMTQQLDELAKPLSGGKLYLIQAGTTSTPQNCYQDTALTIAWPNPVTLDAAGRIGQLFCADGSIKIRLTDKNGVQKLVQDNLLVVGPSGGGGGGGTVDPTTILATGDLKVSYGTGTLNGFVRANGRTIGSATSGANERANADTQALFVYLWGADANLAVSGGRGASGAADFAANKTITLPDWRGRALAGLDDMGSTAAGRLTASYFGTSAIVLGAAGGGESLALSIAQMPLHDHGGSTGTMTANATHSHTANDGVAKNGSSGGGGAFLGMWHGGNTTSATSTTNTDHTHVITAQGGGSPHRTVQPTMLATIYLKL